MKNKIKWIFILMLVAFTAYMTLLIYPQPLFVNKLEYENYVIYSDEPISEEIKNVIDDANQRIRYSELYDPDHKFRLYLCNSNGLFSFFTRNGNAGGVVNFVISGNIFIRENDIVSNRITPPDSWKFPLDDRPLSYFIAHESIHSLQRRYDKLLVLKAPVEILEGYADYVAKQPTNNLDSLIARYNEGVAAMDPKNGLYDKYNLYVGVLIERKKFDFGRLVKEKPDLERTLEEITQ